MISFKPFRQWFVGDPSRRKIELVNNANINSRTVAKLWRDGNVTLETIDKICSYYNLRIEQVVEHVPDDQPKND